MRNAQELALVQAASHERLLTPDAVERLRQASMGSASLPQFLLAQRLVSPSALEGLLRDLNASAFVCAGCAARASFAQLQGVPTLRCPRCGQALTRTAGVESTHAATRPASARGPVLPNTERRSVSQTHAQPSTWIGRQVGAYTIERELGRGSNGVVFLARREGLSRKFALKVLRARAGLTDDETVKRFQREADLASKLSDRAVISVYDVGRDGDLYYYAMDYCPGKDLKERLREGPLPVRDAVELVRELARAMHRAHEQGVVHRDLKPANVILGDEDGRPRITDFGLARGKGSLRSSLTKTGDVIGTPAYMAPEQFLGEDIDRGVDIYALGGILFELLTGQRAFDAPTAMELAEQVLVADPRRLRDLDPSLPAELEAVCLKALARERSERFATAAELEQALAGCLAGSRPKRASSKRGSRRTPPAPEVVAKPRWPAAAAGALVLAALVTAGLLVGRAGPTVSEPPQANAAGELDRLLSYGDNLAAGGVGAGPALEQLIADAQALAGADEPRLRLVGEARDRWALALLSTEPGQTPAAEALGLAARVASPEGEAAARLAAERDRQVLESTLDETLAEAFKQAGELAPLTDVVAPLDALRPRLDGLADLQGRLDLARLRLSEQRGQFQAVVDGLAHTRLPAELVPEAELLRGLALWWLEQPDASLACLESLAESQPATVLGLTARANLLLFRGDMVGAQEAAVEAFEQDQERADALLVLPFTYQYPPMAEGRHGMRARRELMHEQARTAQAVLSHVPGHWRAYWGLYQGVQERNRMRRRMEERYGGMGRPGRRGPWEDEDMASGLEILGTIVTLTRPRPYLRAYLALFDELELEQEVEMIATLSEEVTSLYPERVEAWVWRGMALGGMNERRPAVQAIERALSLDPEATQAYVVSLPDRVQTYYATVLGWRE